MITETVFSVLFEKLTSATLERLARQNGIDSEIRKWKMSLLQIREVLNDASQKEIRDDSVKRWLIGLQHLAYDIDDVLDAVETEAIHREFTEDDQPETSTAKVRKIFSTGFSKFSLRTSVTKDKLDDITTKLQDLVEEKNALGLIVKDELRPNNINRRLQTSMVHEPSIVGRQDEKADLLQKLLVTVDEPSHQNFSIVPIVGMGGVGKTTLARLLYNENQVEKHFELKAWVCVSDDFDSFAISKVIYESVTGENRKFADLNLLQVALRDHLRGKRFLLVLDDVWSESCDDWETLVGPIHACARGSKIIMTTRKEQLLRKLGYDHLNQLSCLSLDDALSLFAQHALGVNSFDSHPLLKPHGEGIVKKCNGLPLALKALGRLLSRKHDEDWKEVLQSEIWRLKDDGGIVPALRLSYLDLSSCLKRLFAYCSSFPKDHMFDRENLVLLWMAEGLLRQSLPTNMTEERLGYEYFEELLSRSFFQHAPNASFFVMHDLMNDLATSVAGEFFLRLDNHTEKDIGKKDLEKCRHLSFVRERYVTYKNLEAVSGAKSLRTFLATSVGLAEGLQWFNLSNKILVDLIPKLTLLRALCLSNFSNISELPDSIGEMRHLRYLNLSRTRITHLPESVSNLYNLQVLIVCDCFSLTKLPNSFSKLKKLRHLDIWNTPRLKTLPSGIGSLSNLQTLSNIIIEGENGFEIMELKDLKHLCGRISIKGLERVQSSVHAREANFSQKRLSELEVEWTQVFDVSRNEKVEKEVLNELKPLSESLKKLKVVSYGGIEFPNWVGDPSFLQLKHVSIHGCNRCLYLPTLGKLPALKELYVKGLHEVKVVGLELLGTGGTFRSLEILKFEDMSGWEVWSTANRVDVFPCLQELLIENCPKLVEVSLEALPSLRELLIENCPKLVEVSLEALPSLRVLTVSECGDRVLKSLVQRASKVTKLKIKRIAGLTDDMWRGVMEFIGEAEELHVNFCNEIRYLWESEVEASKVLLKLRNLCVYGCDNLVSLGKKEEEEEGDSGSSLHLTSLRNLEITCCKNIEGCRVLNSIETLHISYCDSLTKISFPPGGGQKLKNVNIGCIAKVMKPELGGYEGGAGDTSMMLFNNGSSMPMLDFLFIYLPNLKFIIKLNCFLHLTTLMIKDCSSLETFPDDQLSDLASLKVMDIINCPKLDARFPRGLWPPKLCHLEIGGLKKPISQWGHQNFPPSLVELTLYGGSSSEDVIEFSQLSDLVPSSLADLTIFKFRKLESVSRGFQHLTSLSRLCFNSCPKLKDLPEIMFPSLLSLTICFCPDLIERFNGNGSDSYLPLISHIPWFEIVPKL